MTFYIYQDKGYGIGNFINCTPAIQLLSKHFNMKIPVFFENKIVKNMYEECPFIEILEKPIGERLFSSSLVNNEIEDWRYICKYIAKKLNFQNIELPHTYVDVPTSSFHLPEKEYCIIARGCAWNPTNHWLPLKDPGEAIYRTTIKLISQKYKILIVGSDIDKERLFCFKDLDVEYRLNNIKETLVLIKNCKFVVSNDTGVYHIAGAMNKPTFIFWKNTNLKKNKSPGKKCCYSFKENWENDFIEWYKGFLDA